MRVGLPCILIFLLLAGAGPAAAQPAAGYLDSLYTYSYLKHRLLHCTRRFSIPGPELRRFRAAASLADSLAKRWPAGWGGADAYLPYWAAHPELDESAARAGVALPRPAPGNCAHDSAGYGAARKRLTSLKSAAFSAERAGDTLTTLALLDTISREYTFTGALFRAKQLAVASRDTGAYLRALGRTPYRNLSEARRKEMAWPLATTAAQKAFVAAALLQVDSNAIARPPEAPEFARRLESFGDLHDICSRIVFGRNKLPPFMRSNRRMLRRIYLCLVEESYTALPGVLCRYADSPQPRFSQTSLSTLSYLALHLIQINAFGQIYPDSLFENHFRFLRQLAYAGVYDMEDVVSLRDEYLTAIKHQPSEFGYTAHRKGEELSYGIAPSEAVRARREAAHLLPLEHVSP